MRKMQPDRNNPIYCVLRSKLLRSERGLNKKESVWPGALISNMSFKSDLIIRQQVSMLPNFDAVFGVVRYLVVQGFSLT